jgi:chromosomal replication initiator protein
LEQVPKNTWDQVLGQIESKVSPHSYKTWFKPTEFLSEDDATLEVRVPNNWFADWLRTNYTGLIQAALRSSDRPGLTVECCPDSSEPVPGGTAETFGHRSTAITQATVGPIDTGRPAPRLNPRYTFSKFVVASCNQFSHAAARAVAEQPTRAYNPLYIYGGVGLGKTHLMQAIGNHVGRDSRMRMHYTSSEHFMNELINAIRFEKLLEFKEHYRNVDLLLIDDIQFLAGKERTQEEFFHTFNALYDAQKQIVLTSDVPPRDIPTLEDRLRSRFEWGLIADLQPPDLETKVAILRKKAEAENAQLPDDVTLFIASNCNSNIRELEGALIRVIAYASMSGREITQDLARETLKDVITTQSPAATADSIQKLVSNYYNMKVSQLKSKNNSPQIAFPRQIAMYLCKQLTNSSLPEIGRRFGGKHHSTVIHAVKKIDRKRHEDREFDKLVDHFMQSLK